MSRMNINIGRVLCGLSALTIFAANPLQAQNIEVKAYKTRLSDVMDQIALQSRKKIVLNTDQNPLISFGSKESPLADTLKKIENLYDFKFEVTNTDIIVNEKQMEMKKGKRGIASVDGTEGGSASDQRADGFRYRSINMNFQDPSKVMDRVKKIAGESIKFIETDDKNKALVFYGDDDTYKLVRQIVEDIDIAPPQYE